MGVRFYCPDASTGATAVLPDDEAQHLTRVLRLKPGAPVVVFDGRGHEFNAVVERAGRSGAQVRLLAPREPSAREPAVAVTLVQAVLKGDKMDDVVRDAVMIGVSALLPVVTTRSEVALASIARARRRERWSRVAVSSAKQCGRAVVPAILEAVDYASMLDAIGRTLPAPALMFVEPSAGAASMLSEIERSRPRETTLLVGPEGGWTPEEIARGSGPCRLVTMGARTLRADAMALVGLSALFAIWGEF